jgi:hypothetical protein
VAIEPVVIVHCERAAVVAIPADAVTITWRGGRHPLADSSNSVVEIVWVLVFRKASASVRLHF